MIDVLKNIRECSTKLTGGMETLCEGLEALDFSGMYDILTVSNYTYYTVERLLFNIEDEILELLVEYVGNNTHLIDKDNKDYSLNLTVREVEDSIISRFFNMYSVSIIELFVTIVVKDGLNNKSKLKSSVLSSASKLSKPLVLDYYKMQSMLPKISDSQVVQDKTIKELVEVMITIDNEVRTENLTELNNIYKDNIKTISDGIKLDFRETEFLATYLAKDTCLSIILSLNNLYQEDVLNSFDFYKHIKGVVYRA